MTVVSSSDYQDKPAAYFSTPRREMLKFVPLGAKSILEIGCGSGQFGALLKQRDGCRYTGVELVEASAAQARKVLDQVIVADIQSTRLPFEERSFDGLICNDVLEHLIDPWAALRLLTTYLQPEGFVVVSLPNVRFSEVIKDLVVRGRWTYQEQGVLDRTHLRFFTQYSVRELLAGAGLQVRSVEPINPIKFAWRLQFLNMLLLGSLSSMRFPQIAAVGTLPKDLPVGRTTTIAHAALPTSLP